MKNQDSYARFALELPRGTVDVPYTDFKQKWDKIDSHYMARNRNGMVMNKLHSVKFHVGSRCNEMSRLGCEVCYGIVSCQGNCTLYRF